MRTGSEARGSRHQNPALRACLQVYGAVAVAGCEKVFEIGQGGDELCGERRTFAHCGDYVIWL